MRVKRSGGMTEFVPSPSEKRDGVTIRGRLHELPSGIPVLAVPESQILAHGTSEPLADVTAQERFDPVGDAGAGDWDCVKGELMTFDDPETRLPPIDRLEGFRPGRASFYRRVLVAVACEGRTVPAWCYIAGDSILREAIPTGKGEWP